MTTLTHLDNAELSRLDCSTKVLAASLIAALPGQKLDFSRDKLLRLNYSPSYEFTLRAIDKLCDASLVKVNTEISDAKSSFKLQIPNTKQVLTLLLRSINDNKRNDEGDVSQLTINILASECTEYLLSELKIRGVDLPAQIKPPERLTELLHTLTCAEVHMLIWRVMQNVGSCDLKIMTAISDESSCIESIITDAFLLNKEITRNGRVLKGFRNRPILKRSVINKILFDHYYRIGASYFKQLRIADYSRQ